MHDRYMGIAKIACVVGLGILQGSVAGCSVFRGPAPAVHRVQYGRLPPGPGLAPVTVTIPAKRVQGASIVKTQSWTRPIAAITPIRFRGTSTVRTPRKERPVTVITPAKRVQGTSSVKTQSRVHPIAVLAPIRVWGTSTVHTPRKERPAAKALVPVLRVFFAFGSARISKNVRARIRALPATRYCVVGHTDPRGTAAYNLALATRRAAAVSHLLAGRREIESLGERGAGPRYAFDRRVDVYRAPCSDLGMGHKAMWNRSLRQRSQKTGRANRAFPSHPVIYVPRNHEFYRRGIRAALVEMQESAAPNVRIVDNRGIKMKDVRFVGATLWTDFMVYGPGEGIVAQMLAQKITPKFSCVTLGGHRLTPAGPVALRVISRNRLEAALHMGNPERTGAGTRYAPCEQSMARRFRGSLENTLNPASASRLGSLLGRSGLRVHEHPYGSLDARINEAHVLCTLKGTPMSVAP